jgi:VWFA-related protein
MSSLRHLTFFLLCCLPPTARAQDQPQPPASQQPESIRVSVDRVNVGVIVTDARGQFVEGLHQEDFQLLDNGSEQPITGFSAIEEPAQVLVLIEAGPAVYLLESGHLRAARALLDGLSSGDRVAVVKYDKTPQAILDFTPDKGTVGAALEELRFNLGFGSLNLSSSLATVLDWLSQVRGKKTIVLLSSGVDTSSANEVNVIFQRLKTSEVRVLAVSLTGGLRTPEPPISKKGVPPKPSVTTQQLDQADQFLKQLAELTGGRAYFPKSTKDFSAVYAQISQLVRHEYSLAFAPPNRDGAIHSIDVRISPRLNANSAPNTPAPTYRIDHRQAYVAPTP